MWHVPLWPFKQIEALIRRHFEKRQLREQIALQEKQYLLEATPDVDVSAHLIMRPEPPKRDDVPLVHVRVKNYGGKTTLTKGTFRVSLSQDPASEQKQYLIDLKMPKGKEEDLFFAIKRTILFEIITGNTILKFNYELHFSGLNGEPEECKETRGYDRHKNAFVRDN